MEENNKFSTLRQILSSKPSKQGWTELVSLFEEWEEEDERAIALDYASEHLDSWPSELRCFEEHEPEHVCWKLVRTLELEYFSYPMYEDDFDELTSLIVHDCSDLEEPEILANLPKLKKLHLSGDGVLCDVGELAAIETLEELYLKSDEWLELERLDELASLTKLRSLHLYGCHYLKSLDGLESFPELTSFGMSDCRILDDVGSLSSIPNLQELVLYNCSSFQKLEGLSELQDLTKLTLDGCYFLEDIGELSKLKSLRTLCLKDCESLLDIDVLLELKGLEEFSIEYTYVSMLEDTDMFLGLRGLRRLELHYCYELNNLDIFSGMTELRELRLHDLQSLDNLDGLVNLTHLSFLDFGDCDSFAIAPAKKVMRTREEVAEYQKKIASQMPTSGLL